MSSKTPKAVENPNGGDSLSTTLGKKHGPSLYVRTPAKPKAR